ncbi:hypothetical protein BGZ46_000001, partial [Entomortierella lignicola]
MSSMDENEHKEEQHIKSSILVDTDVILVPDTIEAQIDVTTGSTPDDQHDNHNQTETISTEAHATDQNQDDFGDFGSEEKETPIISDTVKGSNIDFDDFGTAAGGNDDGFGDFGTTTGGDDGFGDFGTTTGDDDGFGDFGTAQTTGGDDDFGDFNDFAEGDGFQDSGDFGEFGGADDDFDAFSAPEPAVFEAPVVAQIPETPTAPDFNAVNSRQVENYVLEKLAALYPVDDISGDISSSQLLNTNLDDLDAASLLTDQELWVSLCEQSFQGAKSASSAPQFQWKYSNLRKEYYASLGMVIAKEQNTGSSIPNPNSPSSSRSKISSPLIVSPETIAARKPLDMEAAKAYCQFSR